VLLTPSLAYSFASSKTIMRAIQRLVAAVSMQSQKKVLELPDGSEFEFYMTPLTLAQRARAQKQAKSDDATDFALQLLINVARDAGNAPLFAPGDLAELRNSLPAKLVDQLLLILLDATDDEEEDEEEVVTPKSSNRRSTKTES
jgi:hypothetical protein